MSVATHGIGRSTALAYARAGASAIVLTGCSQETLDGAIADVKCAAKDASAEVRGARGDVTSDEDVKTLAERVESWFGRIDALVVNAGVATMAVERAHGSVDWPRDVCELDVADFRRTFDVNLFGVVGALKILLLSVEVACSKEGEGGWRSPQTVIVVTSSSIHHYDPKLMAMVYSLSKFAAARKVSHATWLIVEYEDIDVITNSD